MKNQVNKLTICNLRVFLATFLGMGLILTACVPATEIASEEWVPTATQGVVDTPTVNWFPVTATPTIDLPATATPNPAATPVFGSLIFSDPFSGDNPWHNAQSSAGYVIVKEGVLTLAVKSARASLWTFRDNTNLTNFYLETTVSVGLCKTDDQIGILFRVNGSQSYYRFLINCQGQESLQQVAGGTPVVLEDWALGSAPAGLYQPLKVGIWQSGSKIRVYVNDELQFEATSDYFKDGGIGFYAHAAGDSPLTVNFTSLNVFNVPAISEPVPTP
jgi:hypothetical protein